MTIDTNIIIAYLGGDNEVISTLSAWKQQGLPLYLPAIVEAEVLAFPKLSPKEQVQVEHFLEQHFLLINFDRTHARITAKIRKETKVKFPDAAIAGTAMLTNSPLVTRNVRDFQKITGLTVMEI